MCMVSVIHDYGKGVQNWDQQTIDQFRKLVEEAMKFDKVANQPHCEDPDKLKWVDAVEVDPTTVLDDNK